MGFEDRRLMRGLGRRLLGVMCIYLFGGAVLLALFMTVPFFRSAMPDLMREFEASGSLDQAAVFDRFTRFLAENSELYTRGLYAASAVTAALGALVFLPLVRAGGSLKALYAPRSLSWAVWGLSVAALLGLNYVGSLAVLGTEWLFNQFGLSILLPDETDLTPLYYVYAILIGPMAEELIFRGGLLRSLRPYGERFALAASSVCFAFFHGNLNQFPGVFLMAMLLGYLCLRTDSLLPSTLAHIGLNALVSLARPAVERQPLLSLPILAAGLVGGLWAARQLYRRLGPVAPAEPSRELRRGFYGTLPMLIFFALCLYNIINSVSQL